MTKLIIPLLLVLLTITSCKKKNNANGSTTADSLYLTYYHGFVPEPDFRYYKIANGIVIEDTTRVFPSEPTNYDYTLPAKNNTIASTILILPDKIVKENAATYNDDETGDCPTYRIKAYIKGAEYNWTLSDCYDKDAAIKQYIEKLFAAKEEFRK